MSPEKQVRRTSYRKSRLWSLNLLLKKYFITGLLVITPLWGTYLILKALFLTLDGVLGGLLRTHFRYYVPGLGVIVLILIILLAGILATNFLGRKVFDLWESFLHRVPVIRNVYSLVKSVVDTLSIQGKEKFNRVVLIEFPRKGQYSIAFVTGVTKGEIQELTKEKVVNIYVPTTPNPTSGYLLLVPESEIIPLSMSVEDGMKMIISGGLYTPSESEGTKNSKKG
jgi:uncharacterized membrane protein